MKKIELDKTLQIVGSFGVIAGILLLAYELRQNTTAAQMANVQATYTLGHESGSWLRDDEFANTYLLGLRDFSQLTDVQKLQFDEYFGQRLNVVEFAFYSRESGSFLEENWDGWDAWFRSEIRQESLKNLWQTSKGEAYSIQFREYVDSILAEE